MTAKSTTGRFAFFHSVYFKCLTLVALACVATMTIVTLKSLSASDELARNAIIKLGDQVVGQIAARSGGALKFGRHQDAQETLADVFAAMQGTVSGAVVLSSDGSVIASQVEDGATIAPAAELAARSLQEGVALDDSDLLIIAKPIVVGGQSEIVGAVALDYQIDVLYAVVVRQRNIALMWSAAAVLVALLVAAFLIRRFVEKPLRELSEAVEEVAAGNYDAEVPSFPDGNEIASVSGALLSFQSDLRASEAIREEAIMKSTALDAGSAAIMIADADFKVVYASRSVIDILKRHAKVIGSRIPEFDPEKILGQSIDLFHKSAEMQRQMLSALGPEGHRTDLEMEDLILELKVSKIDDHDGNRIGYVVEWADVSEHHLNAAVLRSFDANQARAEFDRSGRMVDANDAFLRLAGLEHLKVCDFSETVFIDGRAADPARASFGQMEIRTPDGEVSYALGGLSPVFFQDGSLKRTVLIAADVTEETRQKDAAQKERDELQFQQDAMIDALSQALAHLAEGDLTAFIDEPFAGANDRLREDFNTAIQRLEQVIEVVAECSTTIDSELTSVSSAASELSVRTERQAATLEETAAALSEISASVQSSAENAKKADDVVRSANTNAQSSESVVQDAVDAMGRISKSSSEISSIVKVIDEIAFQTNLLALNAGVEAARAGDAGRGFAVVASEVRALAQRSSEAANEISSLIAASSDNVETGVSLVDNAGKALREIIASITEISDYVTDISSAAQQQAASVAEVSSAMSELDKVTQENAAMFEETTAASQNLGSVAQSLSENVGRFSTRSRKNPDPAASNASAYGADRPSHEQGGFEFQTARSR